MQIKINKRWINKDIKSTLLEIVRRELKNGFKFEKDKKGLFYDFLDFISCLR